MLAKKLSAHAAPANVGCATARVGHVQMQGSDHPAH